MIAFVQRFRSRIHFKKFILFFLITLVLTSVLSSVVLGVNVSAAGISLDINPEQNAEGNMGTIEVLFMLVLVSLAPSLLLAMTSFTRIIIVLSFLRNAIGMQQSPPNQVLIGLALFLSLFVMAPVIKDVNEVAYQPYRDGQITMDEAGKRAAVPLKEFMLRQTQKKDLQLFIDISGKQVTEVSNNDQLVSELTLDVVVPAFITSELKRAFTIGFLLFLPFLIIDIVVSSTLMSMGMVMLPPSSISLPFKVLLFVLVDGWSLLLGTLVQGFR